MDDSSPRTLRSVFREAENRRRAIETSFDARSPTASDELNAAIALYNEALQLVAQLSVLSPNETLEDLATGDLPYLLADYRIAELTQRLPTPSPHDRGRALARARDAYERFLHLLDAYALLSPAQARLFEAYTDDPTGFSTVPADPSARRDSKIANFRAERELRQRLDFLRRQPGYADDDEHDGEEEEGGRTIPGDEEAVREARLAELALCTHNAFQGLEGLNREAEVLARAPVPLMPHDAGVDEDERRRRADDKRAADTERLDPPLRRLQSAFGTGGGPLLTKEGKPLQPFTILGSRAELAKGVFRPGHNLPTMSIDEYLAEERRRGGIIEGGGEASGLQPEPDEDNIDKADMETMKAREWDEFKEANPRGAGNTLNRG
ncbi:uncharacterized protein E0L32_008575 [Thyridium curvatum]|uniref:TAP42-like protein n=1 Tax=Thyridium curvatum TaxID=1093900 RepID=A0A507AJL5_9PEZI|nr:uncharacterized protein E0L32_008575 [Thyridium curvatum]TPX10525.1 hypothetical protein E0L32_008575 [Thyridium curvatum]